MLMKLLSVKTDQKDRKKKLACGERRKVCRQTEVKEHRDSFSPKISVMWSDSLWAAEEVLLDDLGDISESIQFAYGVATHTGEGTASVQVEGSDVAIFEWSRGKMECTLNLDCLMLLQDGKKLARAALKTYEQLVAVLALQCDAIWRGEVRNAVVFTSAKHIAEYCGESYADDSLLGIDLFAIHKERQKANWPKLDRFGLNL